MLKRTMCAITCVAVLAIIGQVTFTARAQPAATTTPTTLPSATILLGGKPFLLEVARTPDEQARGLMYRPSMPLDHGMIFVFPRAEPRSFWMKNTRIPLDIVYLDAKGRVLNVEAMMPFDLRGVESDGPAMYAIELNQGTATALGIQRGDVIALPAGF
jgi:uncharacterized protein